jgi:hypothetical protein
METSQIKTGDNFFTTDYNSFVSKTICKVMLKWAQKKKIPIALDSKGSKIILSHACTFVWIADKLYVMGSIDSGYKPWLFDNHYKLNDPNEGVAIMRRKIPLTKDEENALTHEALHLVGVSFMYQYWNLIQWLALVYLGINLFKKDSDAVTYCYESTYLLRKKLNPNNYGQTFMVDLFSLTNDTLYSFIYTNVK